MQTEHITAAVDELRGKLIDFLCRLVAIDTQTQNPDDPRIAEKLREALDLVKAQMAAFGFECREWPVTDTHPACCGTRAGTGGGRSLACNGHIDVVPAGEVANWLHPPFGGEIADGK